jgi:hypothetical protein
MKKMLLVLVSGLLIACMAGSAMATTLEVTPSSVVVAPNSEETVDVIVSDFPTDNYDLSLSVSQPADAISAEILNSDNLGLLNLGPVDFTNPLVNKQIVLSTGQVVHAKLKISRNDLTDDGTVIIKIDNLQKTLHIEASETVVVEAPEFPTVAAPVAAVLGLLFVFGRKKGGL